MDVDLVVRNDGYAAPFNARELGLVLRHESTGEVHEVALAGDPRRWLPGGETTIDETVSVAGIPEGTYELLLNLPDPSPDLRTRPAYSIRLANAGLWEEATGYNKLDHSITILP